MLEESDLRFLLEGYIAGDTLARKVLLDALDDGSLTVVEAAALLRLPVSAIRVLAAELIDRDLVLSRAPIPPAGRFDPDLLKRVADGLRALKHT